MIRTLLTEVEAGTTRIGHPAFHELFNSSVPFAVSYIGTCYALFFGAWWSLFDPGFYDYIAVASVVALLWLASREENDDRWNFCLEVQLFMPMPVVLVVYGELFRSQFWEMDVVVFLCGLLVLPVTSYFQTVHLAEVQHEADERQRRHERWLTPDMRTRASRLLADYDVTEQALLIARSFTVHSDVFWNAWCILLNGKHRRVGSLVLGHLRILPVSQIIQEYLQQQAPPFS